MVCLAAPSCAGGIGTSVYVRFVFHPSHPKSSLHLWKSLAYEGFPVSSEVRGEQLLEVLAPFAEPSAEGRRSAARRGARGISRVRGRDTDIPSADPLRRARREGTRRRCGRRRRRDGFGHFPRKESDPSHGGGTPLIHCRRSRHPFAASKAHFLASRSSPPPFTNSSSSTATTLST
jgi:hypothetical protein